MPSSQRRRSSSRTASSSRSAPTTSVPSSAPSAGSADAGAAPDGWRLPEYVSVGRILKPHGVNGELKVESLSPDSARFKKLSRLFAVGPGGEREELEVEGCRLLGGGEVLLKFAGYGTPEKAAALKGRLLAIPRSEARRPPPGEVLYADVIGMLAVDASSREPIGRVKAVVTAGNDLLEIEVPDGEVLVPWVPEFVGRADLDAGTIEIKPIPGLLEP